METDVLTAEMLSTTKADRMQPTLTDAYFKNILMRKYAMTFYQILEM